MNPTNIPYVDFTWNPKAILATKGVKNEHDE